MSAKGRDQDSVQSGDPRPWKRAARTELIRRLPEVEDGQETWRPISGYEAVYEVSDQGRVRSLPRNLAFEHPHGGSVTHQRGGVDLIATPDRNGRLQVSLSRDGIVRYFGVARLVLETFAEPAPPGCRVVYADGTKSNCSVENLSWRPRGSSRAGRT